MKKLSLFSCGVLLCAALALSGCGGGNKNGSVSGRDSSSSSPSAASSTSAAATGRATLQIKWPDRSASRLIPVQAGSVVVEVFRGDQSVARQVALRPADSSAPTSVSFDTLPVAPLVLRATAYPSADGTGTAQAFGAAPLVIQPDQITQFGTLTMGTTIDSIAVAPVSGETTLVAGSAPQAWTATAKDASGAVVLVAPEKQQWSSSAPEVASVHPQTGMVTPNGPGAVMITETDTESGKSGRNSLAVAVRSVLTVKISKIPDAAQSVVVTVGDTPKLLPRANAETTLTATVDNLMPGTYAVTATAYATPDGSGITLAKASTQNTLQIGANGASSLALVSEIASVAIAPVTPSLGIDQTIAFAAVAKNAAGEEVPALPSQFTWSSSAASVLKIDSDSGVATGVVQGSATIKVKEEQTGKTASTTANVMKAWVVSPVAQFDPRDPFFAPAASVGGLNLSDGHTYQFDTTVQPAPLLMDTASNAVVATGQYVTRLFNNAPVVYAVFVFAQDIHIGNATVVTGTGNYPLVLMTQGSAVVDGKSLFDVSAVGTAPGAGGAIPSNGPGAGQYKSTSASPPTLSVKSSGGGGFGGGGGYCFASRRYVRDGNDGHYASTLAAGVFANTYGSDLATSASPHLQGGSGGYGGGAGGGALYLATVGTLTINDATVLARGGDSSALGGGGSGGGLVLLGGGGAFFTQATLDASGGKSNGTYNGGGGGGRIVVGYGAGSSPDMLLANAKGGGGYTGGSGGTLSVGTFAGF